MLLILGVNLLYKKEEVQFRPFSMTRSPGRVKLPVICRHGMLRWCVPNTTC